MDPVIKGLITGALLSIYVGATFFILIETSINKGFKAALCFDLGIFLSDICCIIMAYFFASEILNNFIHNWYVGFFGGVVCIGFGANCMIQRQPQQTRHFDASHIIRLLLSGFIVNIFNPSVLIFWLGTLAVALTHFQFSGREIFIYFATTLLVVVTIDLFKIKAACRLRSILKPRIMRSFYWISGALYIVIGILFIISKMKIL
jgi:threonine/homoserine/homoserine lactone efflux protein